MLMIYKWYETFKDKPKFNIQIHKQLQDVERWSFHQKDKSIQHSEQPTFKKKKPWKTKNGVQSQFTWELVNFANFIMIHMRTPH